MNEEQKAEHILKLAEIKAKELLEEAARVARLKLNGFNEEDRTTLHVIDRKVTKVSEDINKVDKKMTDSQETSFTIRDRETLTKVETKLDRAIEDIRSLSNQFTPIAEFRDLEKRVSTLEDGNKWIIRLILGTIILAILGVIIINK